MESLKRHLNTNPVIDERPHKAARTEPAVVQDVAHEYLSPEYAFSSDGSASSVDELICTLQPRGRFSIALSKEMCATQFDVNRVGWIVQHAPASEVLSNPVMSFFQFDDLLRDRLNSLPVEGLRSLLEQPDEFWTDTFVTNLSKAAALDPQLGFHIQTYLPQSQEERYQAALATSLAFLQAERSHASQVTDFSDW